MKAPALLVLLALPILAGAAEPPKLQPDKNDPDAKWLSDLRVPEGFEATIFAHPPMVNYPIFISAAPDGTVYVGSDANGSLDREAKRGKIVRLRDSNGDGKADEAKDFVPNIDSPRGVLWDHDRLFVLHPPDISVFLDPKGTGVATEEKTIVKGIGWTFKDRPADHASNGIELGIDGWIYCAIGDFGFMKAEGTDGRTERFRGGGIVRVRPDGTGLEIYARGTRNILEAAVSPLLDVFARDNTNDGDGWDTRYHHFTGLENHGYPTLFKNFQDEHIVRLADYGGGSATGACWLGEPGIPEQWNNAPLACDWGRSWIYRQALTPNGATFKTEQKEFFGATRVNDVDVDAQSHLFITSWKGATFKFAGPDVGYVVRLSPQGYQPPALPDFEHAAVPVLVKLLESPSNRIRLEAQRALLRRQDATATPLLQALAANKAQPLPTRIAALFGLKQMLGAGSHDFLAKLAADETIAAWAIRALTDRWDQLQNVPPAVLLAGLKSADPRTRKEAAVSVARLGDAKLAPALRPLLDDADYVVAHTAVASLKRLHGVAVALAAIDETQTTPVARGRAFQMLAAEHTPEVVGALLARLPKTTAAEPRHALLTALCRLYFVEGEWTGNSWGTRPDTRGPYYQPEEWAESQRIGAALQAELKGASVEEAKFLIGEFGRHRVNPGDTSATLISLAQKDAALIPPLARQFADQKEAAPQNAVPLLIALARNDKATAADRAAAIRSLVNIDSAEGFRAALEALGALSGKEKDKGEVGKAQAAFFASPKLENQHALLEEVAAKPGTGAARVAEGALLKLAGRKFGSPEAREMAGKALQAGVANPIRARQIIEAMSLAEDGTQAALLVPILDGGDAALAKSATETLKKLKIEPASLRKSAGAAEPLLATMKTDDILAAIVKTKGAADRGQQLFAQQGCAACHTVQADEPLKGPYLGTIANTYPRRELAEAILLPNKSIAQGFASNHFDLKDGTALDGFVTTEGADKVTIRTITSQEQTFKKTDVKARVIQEKSMMPEGLAAALTLKDFASLLDYLESLPKK